MSLNSDLQTLKTNIEGVKSTLYTNLTNKGVTDITESDTLSTLANKVSTITAGGSGIDFSPIGYDAEISEKAIENINDDVAYSKTLYDAWNTSNTSAYELYSGDTKIVYAPNINTSNVTDMAYMFYKCDRLTSVPLYNTSKVTKFYDMFAYCENIKSVPLFDTSKATDMGYMFAYCPNIKSVPSFNTINVTNMGSMFRGCHSLTSVTAFNTSKVTSMSSMFAFCSGLTSVPLYNTSNVTSMDSMFDNCSSLTSVPLFNTSKANDMSHMFNGCSSLTSVPSFDASKATDITSMFQGCSNIKSLPEMDTSNAKHMYGIFDGCSSLTTIEGISFKSYGESSIGNSTNSSIRKAVFKDIGYKSSVVQFNTSNITNWGVNTSEITDARQSLIDSLITYSFDRATAGYPTCTITLSTNTKALLTSDEISQINAKGFTIA